jgi:hypothetical protein
VNQQAWWALGRQAQLQKLSASDVAPDASVQLPVLEHLDCEELDLPPGAPPGSLAAAWPALVVLQVVRRFGATAVQALQGHPLLAKISIIRGGYDATPAGAWPEGCLSALPALKELSFNNPPAAWRGPLLEDLAGCTALERADVACSDPQQASTSAPPAATLQAMAAKVAVGGMARLASLTLSIHRAEQRCTVAEVLPLVEALARRNAGGTAAGAASLVTLMLPVSLGATRADELQQLLQVRGLLLKEFGISSIKVSTLLPYHSQEVTLYCSFLAAQPLVAIASCIRYHHQVHMIS